MDKIIGWLIDPSSAGGAGAPPFRFFLPWMIFCTLGLLIPFYYRQEGRKRFFGSHALNKYLLDKFTNYLWPLALVGWILLGARFAQVAIFGLRVFRYLWLLWAVILFGYWAYYLVFRYRGQLRAYQHQRTLERYIPQPRAKHRRTVRA